MKEERLFHISSWADFSSAQIGDVFTLRPGTQNAEGVGVYFTQGHPVLGIADGCRFSDVAAIVSIPRPIRRGWYVSKNTKKKKKLNRPKTWHSCGRDINIRVMSVSDIAGHRHVVCDTI